MGALAGAAALSGPGALAALNPDAGKNAAGIPLRVLGRTKEKITILGLGTAPVGQSKPGAARGVDADLSSDRGGSTSPQQTSSMA